MHETKQPPAGAEPITESELTAVERNAAAATDVDDIELET